MADGWLAVASSRNVLSPCKAVVIESAVTASRTPPSTAKDAVAVVETPKFTRIVAEPGATGCTRVPATSATAGVCDVKAAWSVTVWMAPSDSVAIARAVAWWKAPALPWISPSRETERAALYDG